ncbi:dihydrofolate reductase family protein [Pseudoalteromonas sp. SMS1]|uniref:dihydrofolate reductase family protein n=1 Tax=Pseudoalteromonas sp. SMS1 TaxID=2908894 RepID=UPI001F249D85|nr:dihydrofolate reductase family protein [Pseudoalteromonas sp. SMS1]MCF2857750.1 dihydrofolate reductase family protein [Pseudoalteromonas sp. SMS1]
MKTKNTVYLAQSLDGFIADEHGGIDWLSAIDNPQHSDLGFADFMSDIDALVMGRNTFEQVLSFGQWPYDKPVYVVSHSLSKLPVQSQGKAYLIRASEEELVSQMSQLGHNRLYIDGGKLVQNFIRAALVDEIIVTTVPIILGRGIRWLPELRITQKIELVSSQVLLNQLVQCRYRVYR